MPPSLLATALLLQTYDKVSDAEAKARADFDIRWKVALGIEIEDRPFAKSTLQMFRAQLILHDKVREVFEGSLRLARQSGYLKKRGMRVALDTTYILGRGAVKDTYNLLADGIVKLLRVLAAVANATLPAWAEAQGYQRYLGSSIKGEAVIDWSDRKARRKLLGEIVADADRLLELARQAWVELPETSAQRQSIVDGAELLGQLLLQDIERQSGDGDVDAHADAADDGVSIRDGVSKDRMLSVHDPELRHGHKSSRRRFNGHKAAIVVDTDSQLITAVDVLPGNAPDNLGALELVERSEASTGSVVEEAMGDAAYGDGGTRQTFADAGRRLVAKVPGRPDRKHFPKDDFHLDLAAGSCTCPAGQVTRTIVPAGKRTDGAGRVYRLQAFQFDGAVCGVCPLRSQCIAAQGRKGRRVLIHPQEGMLQQARALQQSAAYDEYRARRVVVEHRLARLVQLGIRQARYFGRVKTKFQLYLAATVANLTLVAGKIGLLGSTDGGPAGHRVVRNDVLAVVANAAANFSAVRLGQLWSLILFVSALLPQLHFQIRAFRPRFLGANSVTGMPGVLELLWDQPGDSANTGYRIDYAVATDNADPHEWKQRERNTIFSKLPYEDEDLKPATVYYYRVFAFPIGKGVGSTVFMGTPVGSGQPSTVMNLEGTVVGAGQIGLTWDEPADDGGSDIVEYHIHVTDGADTNFLAQTAAITADHDDATEIEKPSLRDDGGNHDINRNRQRCDELLPQGDVGRDHVEDPGSTRLTRKTMMRPKTRAMPRVWTPPTLWF